MLSLEKAASIPFAFCLAGVGAFAVATPSLLAPILPEASLCDPYECKGCGMATGYPDIVHSIGLQYTNNSTHEEGGGSCHCEPTCKKQTACWAQYDITITDYSHGGIKWWAVNSNIPEESVTDSVYHPWVNGECDGDVKDMVLNFFEEKTSINPARSFALR